MAIIRTFGIQTMGASSQPVFGTSLQSAGVMTPDFFTGNTTPGSNPALTTFLVSSAVGFRLKDIIAIGPKNKFSLSPSPGDLDVGTIYSITPGTAYSVVGVQGLKSQHGFGEYMLLNEDACFVQITPVTNTGKIYVGSANTVSSSDTSTFDVIPVFSTGNPYCHISPTTGQSNSYKLMDYWVSGTQNDTFVARWSQTG